MRVVRQLAVFLENKPGTLADMCDALADQGINIMALTVSDTVDHGVVRMVVDKPDEATHLLGEGSMMVVETDVVALEVANRPGSLAELARKCSEADINIEYAYCTTGESESEATLYFRTRDPQKAVELLS